MAHCAIMFSVGSHLWTTICQTAIFVQKAKWSVLLGNMVRCTSSRSCILFCAHCYWKVKTHKPNLWKHGTNADPLFAPHYHLIQNVFCQKRGVSSLKKSKKTFLRKSSGEEEDCKGAFSHHIGQRVSKQMLQNCLLFTQASGSPEAWKHLGQSLPISGLKGLWEPITVSSSGWPCSFTEVNQVASIAQIASVEMGGEVGFVASHSPNQYDDGVSLMIFLHTTATEILK